MSEILPFKMKLNEKSENPFIEMLARFNTANFLIKCEGDLIEKRFVMAKPSSKQALYNMSYVRRYTDDNTDSLALVSISSGATFKNIPNGKYVDAVTGDVKYVTDGTLTVPELAKANMRVYVCCASGFTGIDGQIGGDSAYAK